MLIVAWHSMSGTRPAEIADGNSSSGSGLGSGRMAAIHIRTTTITPRSVRT